MKRPYLRTTLALLLAPLAIVIPATCQETGVTARQAEQIIDLLGQIRQLLAEQVNVKTGAGPMKRPNTTVTRPIEGHQVLGSIDAPLVMVEFSDYECPYCYQFHHETFPKIKSKYIDAGKIRYDIHDYLLVIHANAMKSALAAQCASEQGQYWGMRERLKANPDRLGLTDLLTYARDIGISSDALNKCVESGKYTQAILADVAEAQSLGITGTPAFLIGPASDRAKAQVILGSAPFEVFDQIVTRLLQ
jgi:protein-disulfide isomerase